MSQEKIELARNASRVVTEAQAQQAEALFASVAITARCDYRQKKF
jgi:hypothetical protein